MANRWRKDYQRQKRWRQIEKTLRRWSRRLLCIAGAVAVLTAGLLTLGERLGWPTPTWRQVYAAAGLGRGGAVPADAQGAATRVHFINVGQADATLLEQDGHFALIDAGEAQTQEDLIAYLEAAGVEKLDYVLLTHPHSDHMGGMQAVMEAFDVKMVLLPDFSLAPVEQTVTLARLLEAVDGEGCPVHTMAAGDTYLLGAGALKVLLAGVAGDNVNNLSPALLFTAPGLRFLCTGDAERPVEEALLQSGADVHAALFKAGHHGSFTSNTASFVRAVSPQAAVISCGKDNDYGHPHRGVLDTFADVGAQVYNTAQEGTVVAYVDSAGALRVAAEHAGGERKAA